MSKPPIEMMMDGVQWTATPLEDRPTESDIPHVTHAGVLEIMNFRLRCYTLSDGRRVFDADDVYKLFAE